MRPRSRPSRPRATARAVSSRRWSASGWGPSPRAHAIIERLYQVKYLQNDPIEPSQLGMAVIDALGKYAPHITHARDDQPSSKTR
jgi:hypothetical protein